MTEDTLENYLLDLELQEDDALCLAEGLGYPFRGVTPLKDERREIANLYNAVCGPYQP